MSMPAVEQQSRAGAGVGPPRRAVVGLWAVALGLLLLFAGSAPVLRTQEARVLETAREMIGSSSLRDWMIPTLNDELRVRKPPVTYWMAAGAFEVAGVSEWAGRVPTVLVGWLTLGATYWAGAWLYGRRAGVLGAASLLSSFLFFRHVRLAETDAPAMLCVTVAIFTLWRGIAGRSGWFHVGAVATALAAMSKGGPAAFPVVFLLAAVAATRRWAALWRFLRSGAIVSGVVVALPWFVYVIRQVGWKQFNAELSDTMGGADHGGGPWVYLPMLFKATAPWCGVMVLALWEAAWQWRRDERVRVGLVWVIATFVPLWFTGNKQFHYLLPMMPAVFLLVGWAIDRVVAGGADPRFAAAMKVVLGVTAGLTALAGAGVVLAAKFHLHRISAGDVGLGALLLGAGVVAVVAGLRGGGVRGCAWGVVAAWAVAFPVMTGWWFTEMQPANSRTVAEQIKHEFGAGPYVFYGGERSLPVCFALRQEAPSMYTPVQLLRHRVPGLVVIAQTKNGHSPPEVPPGFAPKMTIHTDEQMFEVYRAE